MHFKITPSHLLSYYFCPRFIWFMYVLAIPEYEERRFKVQKGREIHEDRQKHNPDYLWKKLDVVRRYGPVALQLSEEHLSGVPDDIVELKDGSLAPVDYKWAVYPDFVYPGHRMQIGAYSVLIEKIYHRPVHRGFIFYIRDGSRVVNVKITGRLKEKVRESTEQIVSIIQGEDIPDVAGRKIRCLDCAYRNICVL